MAARQSCLQFEPAEAPVEREKAANLVLIREMEREPRQMNASKYIEDGALDARKAILPGEARRKAAKTVTSAFKHVPCTGGYAFRYFVVVRQAQTREECP